MLGIGKCFLLDSKLAKIYDIIQEWYIAEYIYFPTGHMFIPLYPYLFTGHMFITDLLFHY